MRYWIRSERTGVLGGLGFGSATWQLRARDEWIGSSKAARDANIQQVICHHRFGTLPRVRVPGLASAVLRQAVPRVIDDWTARYTIRPVMIYTHVAADQNGYSYHCADWTRLGLTSGRRGAVGQVWAIAEADDWRETLCRVPHRPIGTLAGGYDGATELDWAGREYGRSHPTSSGGWTGATSPPRCKRALISSPGEPVTSRR